MAKPPTNNIFRKAALDRLSSPEQLHTLMAVTNARGWLALLGCALIIATSLVWGVFGRVQTKVSAGGILLGGRGLTEITAPVEGDITSVEVNAGDFVRKGQVIATLAQPAVANQIASLKRRITELDDNAATGLNTAGQEAHRTRLKGDLERLERQLLDNAKIVSSEDGEVVEVRAMTGEHVVSGTPILALELQSEDDHALEAVLYFDSHQGKALKPGMTIELSPSVVRRERHGVMLGRVQSVSDFPSTRAGMMRVLRNEQLVDSYIEAAGGAPIAVRAQILRGGTPSGYRWSSGVGPDITLTSGTQCMGAAITQTRRPLALLFPALE